MKAIGIFAALACAAAAAGGAQYFSENFRQYNTKAPNINGELAYYVDNDPIWARSANLRFTQGEGRSGMAFVKSVSLPKDNKFDLYFRYSLNNSSPAKDGKEAFMAFFDVVLLAEDGKETRVRIDSQSVAGAQVEEVKNGSWQDFLLKAAGGSAEIYHSHDRSLAKVATLPLQGKMSSFNLFVTGGSHFAVTDISVSDPGEVRSYSAFKQFASPESLLQPIGGKAVSSPEGEEVVLVPNPRAGIRFSAGKESESSLVLVWKEKDGTESTQKHVIKIKDTHTVLRNPVGKKKRGEKVELKDAIIEIGGLHSQWVRPNLQAYSSSYDIEPTGMDVIRDWDDLPAASRHPLDLDFVCNGDGKAELWVDGSIAARLKSKSGDASLEKIRFRFGKGAEYAIKENAGLDDGKGRYVYLDFAANPRAKSFAGAALPFEPGLRKVENVPFLISRAIDSADVAICKQAKGEWALECDEYLGRSPSFGFPSAIHYRIPGASYARAHVLFALDPDASKDRILTIRLSRYFNHGIGGNKLGDVTVDLSREEAFKEHAIREVGLVKRDGRDIPLYLGSFDLNVGGIIDVLGYDSVDFEFLGKCGENLEQIDRTIKPDPDSDSAFNIFAATLEKMPVKISFRQNEPGNVFTVDMKEKRTDFILTALEDGASGNVSWQVFDSEDNRVLAGESAYAIASKGDKHTVTIPFDGIRDAGHYTFKVKFSDSAIGLAIEHKGALAVMPPEKRLVDKWNSPYATWWFNAHGSPGEAKIGGPVIARAGIARASWNGVSRENYEKYRFTGYRITQLNPKVNAKGEIADVTVEVPDPDDPEGKKKIKKTVPGEEGLYLTLKKTMESNPKIDTVMLWHESAPGWGIPEELLGLEYNKEHALNDKRLAVTVDLCARVVSRVRKELGVDISLQIGNSSASIGAAARPLRAGASIESYERLGIETPSQCIPPERLIEVGLQGMVISKDVLRHYAEKQGKPTPKLNGCWEFTYRCERDMGQRQQAQWYMRDVLISLANDFYYISPGILFDCSNAYYNGLWGGSGILERAPFCYPKEAYVAYGVLTSCLDGVKFIRQMDTGSSTVYALEFRRVDGKYAYALWAAKGEVVFNVEGVKNGVLTHMLGAKEKIKGKKAAVKASASPSYLVVSKPVKSISIAERSFAKSGDIASRADVAWAMDDSSMVEAIPDPGLESNHTAFLPILKPSEFAVRTVEDAERGKCIEVALDTSKNTDVSKYITEYTTLRFKEPKALKGKPSVIGVWVKGNSNWGQIRFEIEDSEGEVFKNLTTGRSWGCDIMDWPGNLAVNFDGWSYVYTSLVPNKIVNDHSPGPVSDQWVSEGGNKVIDFPVKVRAVTVGMNRTKLNLLDFEKSSPSICLSDVGSVEE